MKIPGVATTKFPSTNSTNSSVLFASLGTFWTRIFNDRDALKGLTLGQSEELIQRYYEFVDSVNSLSVKDVPELHRERWFPLRIRKSQVRPVPLQFKPAGDPELAVYGEQTDLTSSYIGETFQFGKVKRPIEKRYSVKISDDIREIPLLANRVVAPSQSLVSGIDYVLKEGTLYFNKDPFTVADLMKYQVFSDDGLPVSYSYVNPYYGYTDFPDAELDLGLPDGTLVNEEEILLWGYHAGVDVNTLYNSFGYIFDFKEPDPQLYKLILEKMVNLHVEGPTVQAVTSMFCAFLGVESTQKEGEIVSDVYTYDGTTFVITDKQVYRAPSFYNASSSVITMSTPKRGAVLPAGTLLFDAVEYYDQVTYPAWWLDMNQAVLPPYVFLGGYHGMLTFQNTTTSISSVLPDAHTVVFPFPPEVDSRDQALFNAGLNTAKGRAVIQEYADIHSGLVNPLDFIFTYLLKTNSALVKLKFTSLSQASKFTKFFKVIRDCLPKYIYFMLQFDLPPFEENCTLWRNAVDTPYTGELGSDGTSSDGYTTEPPWTMPFGYSPLVSILTRSFIIARAINLHDRDLGVYTATKGPSGDYDIVSDDISFADTILDGQDANNLPMIYPVATGSSEVGYFLDETTVFGDGTRFFTDYQVGDMIYSAGDTDAYRTIVSIEGDTELTVDRPFDPHIIHRPYALVSITAGSTLVEGQDAFFFSDAQVGGRIYDPNDKSQYRVVTNLISDDALEIDTPFEKNSTGPCLFAYMFHYFISNRSRAKPSMKNTRGLTFWNL